MYVSEKKEKLITDDLLILFPNIGEDNCIGYIPYGPRIKPSDENHGLFLEELSESLRTYMPNNCIALRFDLLWESPWAKDETYFDEKGNWIGPPTRISQELRLKFDTQNWNLKKAKTNILPSDTIFMDLQKEDRTLLQEMKSKTR